MQMAACGHTSDPFPPVRDFLSDDATGTTEPAQPRRSAEAVSLPPSSHREDLLRSVLSDY